MPRVRYPHPDKNHRIPLEFLRDRCGGFGVYKSTTNSYTANYRGYPVVLIDTSKVGGTLTDWVLANGETGATFFLEVKTPEAFNKANNDLRPGEEWLKNNTTNFRFIVSDDDMASVMNELVDEQ